MGVNHLHTLCRSRLHSVVKKLHNIGGIPIWLDNNHAPQNLRTIDSVTIHPIKLVELRSDFIM